MLRDHVNIPWGHDIDGRQGAWGGLARDLGASMKLELHRVLFCSHNLGASYTPKHQPPDLTPLPSLTHDVTTGSRTQVEINIAINRLHDQVHRTVT